MSMKKARIAGVVAVVMVICIFSSILLYSQEWPPISVIESESMTHSGYWQPGTMNVGDIVFVKKATTAPGNIITYVTGRDTGYRTYGQFGNVILYKSSSDLVIIHRAMFYLSWNDSQPVVQGYHNQSWMKVTSKYVEIDGAGINGRNLVVLIGGFVNQSGFITCGDYNLVHSMLTATWNNSLYIASDQNVGITNHPINSSRLVGVAFWDIPWFGLIKLNILRLYNQWPEYNQVAKNSYYYLFASLMAILILAFFPYNTVVSKKTKRSERKKKRL